MENVVEGAYSGYEIKFFIDGAEYMLKTKSGIRGWSTVNIFFKDNKIIKVEDKNGFKICILSLYKCLYKKEK